MVAVFQITTRWTISAILVCQCNRDTPIIISGILVVGLACLDTACYINQISASYLISSYFEPQNSEKVTYGDQSQQSSRGQRRRNRSRSILRTPLPPRLYIWPDYRIP